MKKVHTVGEVLRIIEENYDNPKALSWHTGESWSSIDTKTMIKEIKQMSLALISLGVQKGDCVGIIASPSARWTMADLAIMAIGAVSVPVFANISLENFLFEIGQTELKIAFVSGPEQWERCSQHLPLFTHLINLDDSSAIPSAISYRDFLEKGEQKEKQKKGIFEERIRNVSDNDLATIIYTSGSTGIPKGAEHTQASLCSLLNTEMYYWDWEKDRYLSILPLAHVFARVFNLIMVCWGISAYYYNDIKHLAAALSDVKPTIMIVVPRVLEKMVAKMSAQVESSSFFKRSLGRFAFRLAGKKDLSWIDRALLPLFDKLVYRKLRNALGGKLRVVISGGAPLNPELNLFLLRAGFPIFEGWGLTEACPVTVNHFADNQVGSVGKPIPGMSVRVNSSGELLVKGAMRMRGYYRNKEATEKAIDQEGWLHTGDKGVIDENGFVKIIGRLKEILKTSTGEVIAPAPLEQALSQTPLVELALIIADNRKFVASLLVPDFETVKKLKKEKNLSHLTDEEFLKDPTIRSDMEKFLEKINDRLNTWERIRDFRFIPHPLSVETGELTPSLKIRREAIERRYKSLIDSMYEEDLHE